MKKSTLLVLLSGLVLLSCKKDDDPGIPNPPVSIIPHISISSISSSSVQEYRDSLIIHLGYRDGDGDLGFSSADTMSLYVTDNRKGLTESYHVPPLAPQGAAIAMQGTLKLMLRLAKFNNDGQTEETTLTIKLRDRAGHWSNEVVSQAIQVVP
ncbi:MAG: hypothetical protein M3Q97_00735 [Bacteroidota bacterium]|nr:hypothetical protein [Bacteroidota bacterium]